VSDRDALRELGRRLAALRAARGWAKAEVARRVGLSESWVGDAEAGRNSPGVLALARLARLYGASLDALLDAGPAADLEARARDHLLVRE
jgi:transcriptional regulator with XRE-family HTH domain